MPRRGERRGTGSSPGRASSRRRSSAFELQELTGMDLSALEEYTAQTAEWKKFMKYAPLVMSVFWILLGTIFYAIHDNLGWPFGLLMSVNAGWSIGWPMEDGLSDYGTAVSKCFTIYHTSMGVFFASVTVLYIAEELGKNKDNWIMQIIKMKELDAASSTSENIWQRFNGFVKVHFPNLRVFIVYFAWLLLGLVWYCVTNPEYSALKNADYLASTLTAGGYMSLSSSMSAYQIVITALYANIGVPLLSIVLGLMLSLILEIPDDNIIFEQIVAPVSEGELKFMQEAKIDDGDGFVDCKEFIILAAVRIGTASPELIKQINFRFRLLDRKHAGKISYDDIIPARRKVAPLIIDATGEPETTNEDNSRPRSKSVSSPLRSPSFLSSRNRLIFSSRAKSVHDMTQSPSEKEVQSNIARIESLMKPSDSALLASPTGSMRSAYGSCRKRPRRLSLVSVDGSENEVESSRHQHQSSRHYMKNMSSCDESYDDDIDEDEEFNENAVLPTDSVDVNDSTVITVNDGQNSCNEADVESPLSHTPVEDMISTIAPTTTNKSSAEDSQCSVARSQSSSIGIVAENFEESVICLQRESDDDSALPSPNVPQELNAAKYLASNSGPQDVSNSNGNGNGNTHQKNSEKYESFADVVIAAQDQACKSKHYARLLQASKSIRKSMRDKHFYNKKGRYEKVVSTVKSSMATPYAIAFYFWLLWLAAGTTFFAIEEELSVCEALYVSTSVGYGIFWFEQKSTASYAKAYTLIHFFIGDLGVALAMAVIARRLVNNKKKWYDETRKKRQLEAALQYAGWLEACVTIAKHYLPKLRLHLLFLLWMVVGIVWGVASIGWSVLDAWLFAVTAMATGGLVSLPSDGSVTDGDYVFVSIYIIVGAPLMAISCGIWANSIASQGRSARMESKLNAAMTEDELVMMRHLGVENNDGYIDRGEFAILSLVRIGALNPDLIDVLFDRFWDIDVEGTGAVTYGMLKNRPSFTRRTSSMPLSFMGYIVDSFRGSSKGLNKSNSSKTVTSKGSPASPFSKIYQKIFPSD